MQISRDRIRLQLANAQAEPQDVLSSATPFFFVGNDLQIECALFTDPGTFQNLADISDYATIEFDLKPSAARFQLPVMSETLSSGSFNTALTLAQWQTNDPAQYQFLFTFTNGLTKVFNQGYSGSFWFTIYAWTNDATPQKVTLGAGSITLINDGSNVAAPSYVAVPQYLTLAQANAMFGGTNLGSKVSKSGDTMSGNLQFSGLAGIIVTAMTSTQRNALITSVGAFVLDSTLNVPYYLGNGATWKSLVASVNGLSGFVSLTTDNIPVGATNLYLTQSGVLNTTLAGYVIGSGTVTSADTVLSAIEKLAGATGSVSSVGMTVPAALLTIAGSPITSSGTLALALATQPANYVFAGPVTGSSTAPSFRALVAGDIPAIAQSQVTGLVATLATYMPLAGGIFTGAVQLTPSTPTGYQAASRNYNDSSYLQLLGGTMSGLLTTRDLTVQSAYSASWATAPTLVAHLVNKAYADTKAALAGAVYTGGISFTGTGFGGLTLNNLTATQIAALTPAAGMLVYNTSLSQLQTYNGSWQTIGGGGTSWFSGSGAPSSGTGSNGSYYIDSSTGNIYLKSSGSWSLLYSLAGTGALPTAGGVMTGAIVFTGLAFDINWGNSWLTGANSTQFFTQAPDVGAYLMFKPSTTVITTPQHWDLGTTSGGLFCTDAVYISGNQIITARQANIPVATATTASNTTTINAVLALLQAHGLMG